MIIADLSVIILTNPLKIRWLAEYGDSDIICYSAIGKRPAINAINRLGLQLYIESIITEMPKPYSPIIDPTFFDNTIELHQLRQVKKALTKHLS